MDPIKNFGSLPFTRYPTLLSKNIEMINRCFNSNNLEEIVENLKKEETNFSRLCLDKMS